MQFDLLILNCIFVNMVEINLKRDIKISIIEGKYNLISSYQIPTNILSWFKCPNCDLYPLVWKFNNGSSTGCGCGRNKYEHFSIYSESIMSYATRHNGSVSNYDSDKLRKNWNHWVVTGIEIEPRKQILADGKW